MENNENLNMEELNLEEMEEVSGGKGSGKKWVKATGNVHVRKHADKNSTSLGIVDAGTILSYLNKTDWDQRGVAWYKVNYNGSVGWVSSKYSKLVN